MVMLQQNFCVINLCAINLLGWCLAYTSTIDIYAQYPSRKQNAMCDLYYHATTIGKHPQTKNGGCVNKWSQVYKLGVINTSLAS